MGTARQRSKEGFTQAICCLRVCLMLILLTVRDPLASRILAGILAGMGTRPRHIKARASVSVPVNGRQRLGLAGLSTKRGAMERDCKGLTLTLGSLAQLRGSKPKSPGWRSPPWSIWTMATNPKSSKKPIHTSSCCIAPCLTAASWSAVILASPARTYLLVSNSAARSSSVLKAGQKLQKRPQSLAIDILIQLGTDNVVSREPHRKWWSRRGTWRRPARSYQWRQACTHGRA